MTLPQAFNGRVALVTGGAGGMGRATAIAFGRAGARVAIADIDEEGGLATLADVEEVGATGIFVRTDLSRREDVEHLLTTMVDELGPLSCAANCAAIETETTMLADLSEEEFDRILAVNLRSVFLCLKYEIRAMLARGDTGAIVNIGSTNSFRPQPLQSGYTASKHGVVGLTRNAAIEYAQHGIRVNAITPGAIRTPMLEAAMARRGADPDATAKRLSPLGRLGEPEEIARAVLWLCSDDASFVVGHALAVDGGYLAS